MLTGGELVLNQDTTIDGDQNNDGTGAALSGGNASGIIRASGAGLDVALRDIEFRDGETLYGGAVEFTSGSSLIINNCKFIQNSGYEYVHPAGIGAGSTSFFSGGNLFH